MKMIKYYPTGMPLIITVNGMITPKQLIELSALGWTIQKQAI